MLRSLFFKLLRIVFFNYFFETRAKGKLIVLSFHQVNDRPDKVYKAIPVQTFDKLCAFLARYTNVVLFSEINTISLSRRKLNVIISFDDGHYDILENVMPIIRKYKLKLNINIDTEALITGLPQDNIRVYNILNATKKETYFNDAFFEEELKLDMSLQMESKIAWKLRKQTREERRQFSSDLKEKLAPQDFKYCRILNEAELRSLAEEGVEVGSHSHSHTLMTFIRSEKEVVFEFQKSKEILENALNKKVEIFAYPNGFTTSRIDELAIKNGYKYLLYSGDKVNTLKGKDDMSFHRHNLYQQSASEILAVIFGKVDKIKKLKPSGS